MSHTPRSDGTLDLPFLRKRAKALLKQLRAGTPPDGLAQHPHKVPADYQLADVQWLIAREQGFASWPTLKAHADAIAFATRHPDFLLGDEAQVTHWRCGNDIEHSLRIAGFRGRFQMLADPLVMGPVPLAPDAEYRQQRTRYVQRTFGLSEADACGRFDSEFAALAALDARSEVVLWAEADAYDQLFLVRLLARLTELPRRLELIEIAQMPGVQRFIGIGQLAPDVLAWLWPQRRRLGEASLALARRTWHAYCADDPTQLAQIAQGNTEPLPLLGAALRRQLQELPGSRDGLSLTERLSLEVIAEHGEVPAGRVFAELMAIREPLPYLGDLMFFALLRPLIEGPRPLLHEGPAEHWPQRPLRLTELGQRVLAGNAYWLDEQAPERWVGGVRLRSGEPHWTIDSAGRPRWRT